MDVHTGGRTAPASLGKPCDWQLSLCREEFAVSTARDPRAMRESLVGQTRVFLGAACKSFGSHWCDGGLLDRHNRPLQRDLQNLIHRLNRVNCQACEDLLRDVRQVL